jgi:hypothetical protein
MNDAQIRNKIDNHLTPAKLTQFVALQDSFKSTYGKYFQGIRTPQILPVDGADVDPDLTLHPTDQPQDWSLFLGGTFGGQIPYSIAIHYHNGPLGEGFTIIVGYTNAQGVTSTKSYGTGAYGQTSDWLQVMPPPE